MTVITIPSFLKSVMESAEIRLERTDFVMRSAYTRQRQVLAWHSGHMWVMSCPVPNLVEPQSGEMRAFLADMDGRVNTCLFPVPGYRGPSNGYSGSAGLVKGAGQSGYSIVTDGWAPSQTVLPKGSYVNIGGELKLLTQPLVTDASGEGTMYFKPALRYAPPDNSVIVFNEPYAVMCMSDSNGASWSVSAPNFSSFSLAFEEAVDVS